MGQSHKKVLVALSGGVDSSVSASLLQEEGYEVEGAFIVTWTAPWLPCTWREERLDAMRVASHLHIPFHTVDLSRMYEQEVVEYFVREYKAGRTPNPDVMCNKVVKFGGLLAWALERGFDAIATGHYVRIERAESKDENDAVEHSPTRLLCGVDTQKDQSYFLWTLTQSQLSHAMFPVGGYTKPEVRDVARRYGLPTMAKKDSQGICFLGTIDMHDFLSHYLPSVQGFVLNEEGVQIGHHDGAVFFTLGQRHGFTVTSNTPHRTPLYVVAKNIDENTITVAPRERMAHMHAQQGIQQRITLISCNWISGNTPDKSGDITHVQARFRYRQPLFPVTLLSVSEDKATVLVSGSDTPIPPGQSLVCYAGGVCLGGGIIDTVTPQ